jgi:hypothetical protein
MRVGIVCGGRSGEHEISLQSAMRTAKVSLRPSTFCTVTSTVTVKPGGVAAPWALLRRRADVGGRRRDARFTGRSVDYRAGWMFWFRRNRLSGSYLALICARRS